MIGVNLWMEELDQTLQAKAARAKLQYSNYD